MKPSRAYRMLVLALLLAAASITSTCSSRRDAEPAEYALAKQIALGWNHLLLELEWHTAGYRAPISARMFAYAEMAAYEASLPAMNGYMSLDKLCPGYQCQKMPTRGYYLPASLNAAYATISRAFFPTAPEEFQQKIGQLEAQYRQLIQQEADTTSIQLSIEYGTATAASVWNYSMQDSIGHDGFMYNYDRNFKINNCAGCWKSDEARPMPPLLPYWGSARPFVVSTHDVVAIPPDPFDEAAPSKYYAEAMEVFSISQSLSPEDRWIAEFWSDDLAGLTISSTGRWISITNQAIEKADLPFPAAMETYLKTAIALCDASIICWDIKYKYQVERPATFIRSKIQSDWTPMHSNPSFPSYPSGHAIFGAAAAEILDASFGKQFSLVDRTHEGRKEFAGKARAFKSFGEMADESAYSRVLIGVHFRMDCEEGLRLGKIIGQKVVALTLRRQQTATLLPK